jgi:lysophospholipase L1-like esterase
MKPASLFMFLVALVTACGGSSTAPAVSATPAAPGDPGTPQQGCGRTSVGFLPLTEMGSSTYEGEPGGLYPNGSNAMPGAHLGEGLERARAIGPLDKEGRPSGTGRYVFMSIGMSNTTQEFSAFKPLADADGLKDPRLVIVDAAQGGVTATDWSNPNCPCWTQAVNRLQQAGVSAGQVTTAWIKLAERQPSGDWPVHAQMLHENIVRVLQQLPAKFPNLRIAYLTSRIYAGYATSTLNPEPYAYQSAFSVRWTIEQQLSGGLPYDGSSPAAPWLAWGPYLWADGLRPRSDGLTWTCADFQSDGTHPSASGRQKVASRLLEFVRTDPTAREWYLAQP